MKKLRYTGPSPLLTPYGLVSREERPKHKQVIEVSDEFFNEYKEHEDWKEEAEQVQVKKQFKNDEQSAGGEV